jgi:hypothetical protein
MSGCFAWAAGKHLGSAGWSVRAMASRGSPNRGLGAHRPTGRQQGCAEHG